MGVAINMKLVLVFLITTYSYASCHMDPKEMEFEDDLNEMRPRYNGTGRRGASRVWTFGLTSNIPPYAYLDESTMEVNGMAVDVIRAVCQIANQRCVFVFNNDFTRCWSDATQSSKAMDNGWIDACPAYHRTPRRALMYAFSHPYTVEPQLFLYIRNNDNIKIRDLMSENDISIGFVSNVWSSPECLERNGRKINKSLIRFYSSFSELFEHLDNEEVRVIFTYEYNPDQNRFKLMDLEGMSLSCAVTGLSVMTRKDNVEMLEWINPAIDELVHSDDYKRMCYLWPKIFNEQNNCF